MLTFQRFILSSIKVHVSQNQLGKPTLSNLNTKVKWIYKHITPGSWALGCDIFPGIFKFNCHIQN